MSHADLNQLWSAAQAGSANAQERLADLLASAGRAAEARAWLARAATGSPAAATRLGLWEIVGFGGPADAGRGIDRIIAGADSGHADSAHVASMIHCGGVGTARDAATGMRRLVQSARLGHVRALAQLGILIGASQSQGQALLQKAARGGSTVAMHALSQVIPGSAEGQSRPAAEPDWDRLCDLVDLGWVRAPFVREVHSTNPRIELLPRFLPLTICDYVIGMAAPALTRGKVVDEHGGESVRAERSNAVMTFGLIDSDFLLELINERTAAAAEMPSENAEGLGVLHYLPGESYATHTDFIPDAPANAAQLAARGQRTRTLLVYLNNRFTGGETEFPMLGLRFKPPPGTALFFHNVDACGQPMPRTAHAGMPPSSGEKWLISKWFRSKALRPGPSIGRLL